MCIRDRFIIESKHSSGGNSPNKPARARPTCVVTNQPNDQAITAGFGVRLSVPCQVGVRSPRCDSKVGSMSFGVCQTCVRIPRRGAKVVLMLLGVCLVWVRFPRHDSNALRWMLCSRSVSTPRRQCRYYDVKFAFCRIWCGQFVLCVHATVSMSLFWC